MPEMHLKNARFMYSACGPFTKKSKERVQRFKGTGDLRYVYHDKLIKAFFNTD